MNPLQRFRPIVALLLLASAVGCGNQEEKDALSAAEHYTAAFYAIGVPAEKYGKVKEAIEANDHDAAKTARDAYVESIGEARKKLGPLTEHPWKVVNRLDLQCNALIKAHETEAVPEVDKIIAILAAGDEVSEEDEQKVVESFRIINSAIYDRMGEAQQTSTLVQTEIAIAGAQ